MSSKTRNNSLIVCEVYTPEDKNVLESCRIGVLADICTRSEVCNSTNSSSNALELVRNWRMTFGKFSISNVRPTFVNVS